MKKLIQNRLHIPGKQKGNCYPTVIACLLGHDSPEDVIQIQEHYDDEDGWYHKLEHWLEQRGWEIVDLQGHQFNDEFYLVTGQTKRSKNTYHVCIYLNGELWHDPHPDQSGLITEEQFEYLKKFKH